MSPGADTRIEIVVNGEPHSVPDGSTVSELLDSLGLPADRVAVEYNREILKKDRWPETRLQAGDRLEIVHFVGGG